jgi:MtN3 and saliva related transmembrane protein
LHPLHSPRGRLANFALSKEVARTLCCSATSQGLTGGIRARPQTLPETDAMSLAFADATSLIGFLAGCLTTIAFLPQAIKAWRTRSTSDLSLTMFLTFCLGVICWIVYGLALGALPLILANAVTLLLAGSILLCKLVHR